MSKVSRTYTFDIDIKSRMTGERYQGTFILRRPSLADLGQISAMITRINNGASFSSAQYEMLFTVVATIAVCGSGKLGEFVPTWWDDVVGGEDGDDVVDTHVVGHVGGQMAVARDKSSLFRFGEGSEEPEAPSESTV